jgi:hypothetical protein
MLLCVWKDEALMTDRHSHCDSKAPRPAGMHSSTVQQGVARCKQQAPQIALTRPRSLLGACMLPLHIAGR